MSKLVENFNFRKVGLADLEDFPRDGIHHHLMRLASFCSGSKISALEAVDLIYQKFNESPQRRQLQPREVENAVDKAFGGTVPIRSTQRGFLLPPEFEKTTPGSFWNTRIPLPTKKPNKALISRSVKSTPWTLEDMWEESPLRLDEFNPAQILSLLYEPTELVCCGSVNQFMTLTVSDWLNGDHWMGDQVVPNPSRLKLGVTLSNNDRLSAHSRDATGKRRYIVIESDDETLSFDEKAAVLKYLSEKAGGALKMVVHTGGKSLHGWYKAAPDEFINWKFMELACLLGADPRMWLPEQLARLPNAVRIKNQKLQKTFYFDPS